MNKYVLCIKKRFASVVLQNFLAILILSANITKTQLLALKLQRVKLLELSCHITLH